MKRILEFRTKYITTAIDALEARDRAIMMSAASEVDGSHLNHEVLTPDVDGTPLAWEVCLGIVFQDGIEVRHWSRIVRDAPPARYDLHGETRRLSGGIGNPRKARDTADKIRDIVTRSATSTVFFFAVARLEDGRTHQTLWWHPSLTKGEAIIALDSMVHYALEEEA